MPDREERIRERAHQLWEQEGRPDGRDADHWERAAREVDAEDRSLDVGTTPAKTAPPASGGLASGLQPGGTVPGGSPGASTGSIGTGGGSTGGSASGSVRRS
jgi:hypothetical protein